MQHFVLLPGCMCCENEILWLNGGICRNIFDKLLVH